MTKDHLFDVAIVGAGPAGLTAGCVLQAAGLDVVTLDASSDGAHTSRAAVVHARTLEMLEELDVSRRLVAAGVIVPTLTVRDGCRVLARLDFSELPTRHPYALMLPQSRTEAVLSARLQELGGEVRRGHTVTTVLTDPDQVTLAVEVAEQRSSTVRSRFVIGADGMHSTVRAASGIAFAGSAYEQSFVLADVRLQWALPRDEGQLFFSPRGLMVVAPLLGGEHRIVATAVNAPRILHLRISRQC